MPLSGLAAFAVVLAGLNGACAVALGAWAAHGLDGAGGQAADQVATAARYQMGHALALIAVVVLHGRMTGRWARRLCVAAGACFAVGIDFFVGGLLASAFAGVGWPAPVGGALFILGWIALAGAGLAAWRGRA